MKFILQPWQLFFLILAGWINQRQQQIIEFQNAEIEAFLKKLGKKRILLTDDQRQILAVKGKPRTARWNAASFYLTNSTYIKQYFKKTFRNGKSIVLLAIR